MGKTTIRTPIPLASSKDLTVNRENKNDARRSAEQDVLMREVDEAVRADQVADTMRRHGWKIGLAVVLVLGAFGGWLYWQRHTAYLAEQEAQELTLAYDALERGDIPTAQKELAPLAEKGGPAAAASARMTMAAIALGEGRKADAVKQFTAVATDKDAPQPYRDLALLRQVTVQFDELPPQQVIDKLKPLATPGNPWFGSAGEVVAMAYLKQGRNDLAGPLFASIAKDEKVPQSIRSRTRQLAGLLGVDAVVDVDKTLADLRQEQAGEAGPGAAQ